MQYRFSVHPICRVGTLHTCIPIHVYRRKRCKPLSCCFMSRAKSVRVQQQDLHKLQSKFTGPTQIAWVSISKAMRCLIPANTLFAASTHFQWQIVLRVPLQLIYTGSAPIRFVWLVAESAQERFCVTISETALNRWAYPAGLEWDASRNLWWISSVTGCDIWLVTGTAI